MSTSDPAEQKLSYIQGICWFEYAKNLHNNLLFLKLPPEGFLVNQTKKSHFTYKAEYFSQFIQLFIILLLMLDNILFRANTYIIINSITMCHELQLHLMNYSKELKYIVKGWSLYTRLNGLNNSPLSCFFLSTQKTHITNNS